MEIFSQKEDPHKNMRFALRTNVPRLCFLPFFKHRATARRKNGPLTSFLIHVSMTRALRYVDWVEETFFSRRWKNQVERTRNETLCILYLQRSRKEEHWEKQRSKKNMQREDIYVCVRAGVHGGNWVEPETKMRTQRNWKMFGTRKVKGGYMSSGRSST